MGGHTARGGRGAEEGGALVVEPLVIIRREGCHMWVHELRCGAPRKTKRDGKDQPQCSKIHIFTIFVLAMTISAPSYFFFFLTGPPVPLFFILFRSRSRKHRLFRIVRANYYFVHTYRSSSDSAGLFINMAFTRWLACGIRLSVGVRGGGGDDGSSRIIFLIKEHYFLLIINVMHARKKTVEQQRQWLQKRRPQPQSLRLE